MFNETFTVIYLILVMILIIFFLVFYLCMVILSREWQYFEKMYLQICDYFSGKEEECPICYQTMSIDGDYCITRCGHRFCLGCIVENSKRSLLCPLCRDRITANSTHRRVQRQGRSKNFHNNFFLTIIQILSFGLFLLIFVTQISPIIISSVIY